MHPTGGDCLIRRAAGNHTNHARVPSFAQHCPQCAELKSGSAISTGGRVTPTGNTPFCRSIESGFTKLAIPCVAACVKPCVLVLRFPSDRPPDCCGVVIPQHHIAAASGAAASSAPYPFLAFSARALAFSLSFCARVTRTSGSPNVAIDGDLDQVR